jgi:ElaB/YqjD/DUF883 family membrane-anchored ribosome-binding protein
MGHENDRADADIVEVVDAAAPRAREFVRSHPLASVSVAVLAGAWLVRRKPWRSVGGSLVAGVVARQVLALALSSGSALRRKRTAGDAAKREAAREP